MSIEKKINNIEKHIIKRHRYLVIPVWHFDKIMKSDPKNGIFICGLYIWYQRELTIKQKNSGNLPISKIQYFTKSSRRRIAIAKNLLLKLGYIKQGRIKDPKTKKVKLWITYLPYAVKKAALRNIIEKNGLQLESISEKKSHSASFEGGGLNMKNPVIPKTTCSFLALSYLYRDLSDKKRKGIFQIIDMNIFEKENKYFLNEYGIKRNPPIKKISPSDPKHPKNKKYLALAKQLYRILRNKKKLHPTAELKFFSKEIRLLIEIDLKKRDYSKQEAIQEVKTVLKYYKNHIGDKYCPQAFGPYSFRIKFDKLQNAVERENATESKQNKSDGLIEDGILIG